jgi:Cu/Ag efflux protein CusF
MLNSSPWRPGPLRQLLLILLATTLSVSCGQQQHQAGKTAEPTPELGQAAASPIPWKTIEPPSQVGVAEGTTPRQTAVIGTYTGTGIVRLINLKEGWVEIDHEEIKGLMPAMQMEWSVKDKSMLKAVQVGDKVDFTVEDNNGSEVILELKKAPITR